MLHGLDLELVHCHAGGEVGDVVVAGLPAIPGETVYAQSRHIAADGRLRNYLLQEPRGGVFRHANLLVPPRHPAADAAFIILEPADTPPMSGSNTICVATVLLECGLLPMREPETRLLLEAPGGLVAVTAGCRAGRVDYVEFDNLPAFVSRRDLHLALPGRPALRADIAFGGDSFAIVDADDLGIALEPSNARELARLGTQITAAANRSSGFRHPDLEHCDRVSFCLFRSAVERHGDELSARHAVAIRPGKIDRSPTGTAMSAHLALLAECGIAKTGDSLLATSIIGSQFRGVLTGLTQVAGQPAVQTRIRGSACVFGRSRYRLDPRDPWPQGYRLNDTWPEG